MAHELTDLLPPLFRLEVHLHSPRAVGCHRSATCCRLHSSFMNVVYVCAVYWPTKCHRARQAIAISVVFLATPGRAEQGEESGQREGRGWSKGPRELSTWIGEIHGNWDPCFETENRKLCSCKARFCFFVCHAERTGKRKIEKRKAETRTGCFTCIGDSTCRFFYEDSSKA